MGFPEIGCALTAFWQNWEHSREKEARKCLEMKGETLDLEGWKPSSSQPERQSNKQSSESSRICSAESSSRPTELLRHKKHRYMFLVSDQSQQILLHQKTHRQKTGEKCLLLSIVWHLPKGQGSGFPKRPPASCETSRGGPSESRGQSHSLSTHPVKKESQVSHHQTYGKSRFEGSGHRPMFSSYSLLLVQDFSYQAKVLSMNFNFTRQAWLSVLPDSENEFG